MRDEFIRADMIPKESDSIPKDFPEDEPLDGCPEAFPGNLKVNRYCRKQPVEYQKFGGEKVINYQLCPPRCYRDNWHRCPLR